MANRSNEIKSVEIPKIRTGRLEVCILGKSPLICNRMSEKVRQELLLPKGRKTSAEKRSTLKHNPLEEFRATPYMDEDPKSPTLLLALNTWFKQGMRNAAIDVPGSSKAQIGRLLWVGDGPNPERTSLYGIPQLYMGVVRNSDMNRTPDIRSRARLEQWACRISVEYIADLINDTSVINLLVFAGISQGVGDYRVGKGSGAFGQYEIVKDSNPRFKALIKEGRKAQLAAMSNPTCVDDETERLFAWSVEEIKRRGRGLDPQPLPSGVHHIEDIKETEVVS